MDFSYRQMIIQYLVIKICPVGPYIVNLIKWEGTIPSNKMIDTKPQ